jgi:alpha-N-arabinofuranosidase
MSLEKSFSDAGHYDNTDRNGPKIFVGEWATREGEPTSNLGAALGDAAWMTGMERNSDIIIMTCYAPLFVNVNPGGMQWESDLIGYDALTSYGSPSYWAQVMFGNHLGTEAVASTLDGAGPRVYASTTRNDKLRKIYVKVVNGTSETRRINFTLNGISSVKPDALLVTMSGKSPNATNSIQHPDAIKPIDRHVKIEGLKFERSFEPYSVNVLEMSY